MKILLISAPTKYGALVTSDWETTAEDLGAFPPIGLSYLAGYLVKNSDHDVEILDSLGEHLAYEEIEQRVIASRPDIVGVTAFTTIFYDILMLVRLVKKNFPNCYVCIGGSHVNTHLEDTLHHPEIDFVVRGEGEEILCNLANALEKGDSSPQVDGVSYKDKKTGEVINVGPPGYHKDINLLPMPAFHLLPLHLYKSAVGTGKVVGVIATSRGCPYDCTFCNRPYRSYRSYTVDRTLDEMQILYDMGHREFLFFDDMFNINPKRVIDYADGIKERFPAAEWAFRGRVEQVTKEMVRKAKAAGCRQILFGADGGSEEDFISIKKKITLRQIKDAISMCKKEGIETCTNWIIGLPTHRSREDILSLLDFAIKAGSDYAQFHILIPFSDAPLYKDGVEKGIFKADWWSDYIRNPTPNAYTPVWDEYMTREEISELLKICYRKFYFRPTKFIKEIARLQSYDHFKIKLKGLMTILGYGGFSRNEAT